MDGGGGGRGGFFFFFAVFLFFCVYCSSSGSWEDSSFASLHSIALTYTRWLLDYLLLQLDLPLRLPRQTWP